MKDANLYEIIPRDPYPIKLLWDSNNKYDFSLHWHEHIELHCMEAGESTVRYGDEYFHLKTGDCVIINGNELHMGAGGLCDYTVILLSPDLFEDRRFIFKKLVRDQYIMDMVDRIKAIYHSNEVADKLLLKAYAYQLASHLVRSYTCQTLDEGVYSKYFDKLNKVNGAVKYINEHYDKHISTNQLAATVHLSEGYFCQIFKEVTGKTAVEYLNALRADKAEELLLKTEMTVTEIAFCCGFEDANYFSRTFKKIKKKTPQSLRRCGEETKAEQIIIQ